MLCNNCNIMYGGKKWEKTSMHIVPFMNSLQIHHSIHSFSSESTIHRLLCCNEPEPCKTFFSLLVRMMLSFINGVPWEATRGRRNFSSWFQDAFVSPCSAVWLARGGYPVVLTHVDFPWPLYGLFSIEFQWCPCH